MPAPNPPSDIQELPFDPDGAGVKIFNDRLRYIYEMLSTPGDDSLEFVPGANGKPGILYARAKASATVTYNSLQIVDASSRAHPGRIRIVAGTLFGVLPDNMSLTDAVLPNGTDGRCYLVTQPGQNFVYGKVLVSQGTGFFSGAQIYLTVSQEEADGTYIYFWIGVVNNTAGKLSINQLLIGSQTGGAISNPLGTLLTRT